MSYEEHYAFRGELAEVITRDLVGPSSPDEELTDAPLDSYISGILYPISPDQIDPAEDVDVAEDGEDAPWDPPVALANVRYPSSMGMTFSVDPTVSEDLQVQIEAALYEPLHTARAPQGRRRRRQSADQEQRWRRRPISLAYELKGVVKPRNERISLEHDLELFVRTRRPDSQGVVATTVVLMNGRRSRGFGERDADSFFQSHVRVRPTRDAAPFVERSPGLGVGLDDEDVKNYRLLYSFARTYAVGHGCSVEWEEEVDGRAREIQTVSAPVHELAVADSNPAIDLPCLAMTFLAFEARDRVVGDLRNLCAGYQQWLEAQDQKTVSLPQGLRPTAEANLRSCREALRRMRAGVDKLERDDIAWEAFRLANRAMLQQRARSDWLKLGRPSPEPVEDDNQRWRPFQVAFILLCLEGLADVKSADRSIADLLWFPTGGGKTEAYLALVAFTVFRRRLLHGDEGAGVSALMRYTLRLLTIQQFERAALLICACEKLRREEELGDTPITIGLWVGQDASPNTLRQARTALDKITTGAKLEKGNPIQLQACPWCGEQLDHRNYYLTADRSQMIVACRQDGCYFRDGIPAFIVDEDVYRHRPSLLIATVDKFASVAWREQVADLFNLNVATHMPPDLIIQDELHLISGPLGTLTGLYETAVDFLCTSEEGVRPKVIASTATIRRAERQTRGLFDRELHQFPPPALDARDSYFAVQAPPDRRGTRLYLGLMAPGTSHATLMIRTYAALLDAVGVSGAPAAVRDTYWTLVGYFNSLRVLGGARMQVQDDVGDRLEFLGGGDPRRDLSHIIELTSREASAEIPRHLRRMSVQWPDEDALDVILATNMISVGVDIDRLGLMVVMGQPQSTSEYIQATSRVGRASPGLVVMLHNSARSRDRSHYESFVSFHSAMYRQVESASVTPFSPRARDRALHAVLVALCRLQIPQLRANEDAHRVKEFLPRVRKVGAAVLSRVEAVSPEEKPGAQAQIGELIAQWVNAAESVPNLVYEDTRHPDRALLVAAGTETDESPDGLSTMWSLRDVDVSSNLYLVR